MDSKASPDIEELPDKKEKRELGYDEGLPFQAADDFDTFVPPEFVRYMPSGQS